MRSTIDLGHNLGLPVLAEGVETKADWETLTELGSDLAQGYVLARPAPADKLEALLRAGVATRPTRTVSAPQPTH